MEILLNKCKDIVVDFLFLAILLWSVLLKPKFEISQELIPQSFSSVIVSTSCDLRIQYSPSILFTVTFLSIMATIGYYTVNCTKIAENITIGQTEKYFWILTVPWLIKFACSWARNLILFFQYILEDSFKSSNWFPVLYTIFFLIQIMLVSKVFVTTLKGWHIMTVIIERNRQ